MRILRKAFARKDYEGLTEEGAAALKKQRDLRAARLNTIRHNNNDQILKGKKKDSWGNQLKRDALHESTLENSKRLSAQERENIISKFGKAPAEHVGQAPKVVKGIKESVGRDPVSLVKVEPKKGKALLKGKAGKIAAIAGGTALAAGAGAYAYNKYKNKDKQFSDEEDHSVRNAAIAGGVGLGATALGGHVLGNVSAYKAGKAHVTKEKNILDKANREVKRDFNEAKSKFTKKVRDNKNWYDGAMKRNEEARQKFKDNLHNMTDAEFDRKQAGLNATKKAYEKAYQGEKDILRNSWKRTKEDLKSRADQAAARYNKNTSKEVIGKVGKKAYGSGFAKVAGAGLLATGAAAALAYNKGKKKES